MITKIPTLEVDDFIAKLDKARSGDYLQSFAMTVSHLTVSSESFLSLTFKNTTFVGCVFEDCNFMKSQFSNVRFFHCEFRRCLFNESKFNCSTFNDCKFSRSVLQGVVAEDCFFSVCMFTSTSDFHDCKFYRSSFAWSTIMVDRFSNLLFQGCLFPKTSFSTVADSVDFVGCDFSLVIVSLLRIRNCLFTQSVCGFPIPVVEDVYARIQEAVNDGKNLDMKHWHSCDTTHCIAGWAIHLAGEAGYDLESHLAEPGLAGALILGKSAPTIRVPDFHASNEMAITQLASLVEEEKALKARESSDRFV